jgi:hypothetical protein
MPMPMAPRAPRTSIRLLADSCRVMLLPALREVSQAPPESRAFLHVPRRWFLPHRPWTPSRSQKSLSDRLLHTNGPVPRTLAGLLLGGASYFSTALYGVDVPREREYRDDGPFRTCNATIERCFETRCFYYIQRGTTFNILVCARLSSADQLLERIWGLSNAFSTTTRLYGMSLS